VQLVFSWAETDEATLVSAACDLEEGHAGDHRAILGSPFASTCAASPDIGQTPGEPSGLADHL
jgi:hypothetical protein